MSSLGVPIHNQFIATDASGAASSSQGVVGGGVDMSTAGNLGVGYQTNDYIPNILCCMCGTPIQSNPANMCVNCLKTKVDITEGISKQVTLFWCRGCGRYQRPPYVNVELESREMLALCLKKIKGLNKEVKLVDAGFIWTEPHSKRIKVKLTIQKEIFSNAIIQQVFVVEFIVENQQCVDCQKSYTEHVWNTVVQIRQKVDHKKSMLYLEQMLLKHNVCEKAMYIKEMPGGMDIYWGTKSGANHLLDFLRNVVPIRSKLAKRLISQDDNSNIFNYKYTMYAELAPICKDDLVLLEPKLANQLGGVSQLLLCTRVTAGLTLLDPLTLKLVEVSAGTYWHHPFRSQLVAKQMIEYFIIDVEKIDNAQKERDNDIVDMRPFNKQSLIWNQKLCLATITCQRVSDVGVNDETFELLSHLGNMLKPGDHAWGYDLTNANLNDEIKKTNRQRRLPDVILVKKSYSMIKKANRQRRRAFELKTLPKESSEERQLKKSEILQNERDLEEFMNDIEEDPELQGKVNLYKRKTNAVVQSSKASKDATMDDDDSKDAKSNKATKATKDDDDEEEEEGVEDFPEIDMDQLLDDMGNVRIGQIDEEELKRMQEEEARELAAQGLGAVEEESDWNVPGGNAATSSSSSSSSSSNSKGKKGKK